VYSKALLKTVLTQNPVISKPDQIVVGQVIKLPADKEEKERNIYLDTDKHRSSRLFKSKNKSMTSENLRKSASHVT
jgi:hypothetical protein